MLNNTLTYVDAATTSRSYDLISREGMNSLRRETTAGVASSNNSGLAIKQTIDLYAPTKANRHLVQFTYTEVDSEGRTYPITVHAVITRHKQASDAEVLNQVALLADFLGTAGNAEAMLIGSN